MKLSLTGEQADELRNLLEAAVADLSHEIAGYRQLGVPKAAAEAPAVPRSHPAPDGRSAHQRCQRPLTETRGR